MRTELSLPPKSGTEQWHKHATYPHVGTHEAEALAPLDVINNTTIITILRAIHHISTSFTILARGMIKSPSWSSVVPSV